jgi:chorismate synthase
VGGAIAKLALKQSSIQITAYTSQVGNIQLNKPYSELDFNLIESTPVRCPDLTVAQQMIQLIQEVKADGDTIGGVITCVCQGVPAGLGEPVFGKLHAALGNAMLSINAVKGFEYGLGFESVRYKGSEINDLFYRNAEGGIATKTNYSGGIQGGISNGEAIYFRVAFKPVATLLKEQQTVNTEGMEASLKAKGRHDPCVLPRAVPIVEAMAAMTILDYYLYDTSISQFHLS